MGVSRDALTGIDVLPLRGKGIDLLKLEPFSAAIEPNHYALVILMRGTGSCR